MSRREEKGFHVVQEDRSGPFGNNYGRGHDSEERSGVSKGSHVEEDLLSPFRLRRKDRVTFCFPLKGEEVRGNSLSLPLSLSLYIYIYILFYTSMLYTNIKLFSIVSGFF